MTELTGWKSFRDQVQVLFGNPEKPSDLEGKVLLVDQFSIELKHFNEPSSGMASPDKKVKSIFDTKTSRKISLGVLSGGPLEKINSSYVFPGRFVCSDNVFQSEIWKEQYIGYKLSLDKFVDGTSGDLDLNYLNVMADRKDFSSDFKSSIVVVLGLDAVAEYFSHLGEPEIRVGGEKIQVFNNTSPGDYNPSFVTGLYEVGLVEKTPKDYKEEFKRRISGQFMGLLTKALSFYIFKKEYGPYLFTIHSAERISQSEFYLERELKDMDYLLKVSDALGIPPEKKGNLRIGQYGGNILPITLKDPRQAYEEVSKLIRSRNF